MDAHDRCTNLEKILPIVLLSMVEAEKFSDHSRTAWHMEIILGVRSEIGLMWQSSVNTFKKHFGFNKSGVFAWPYILPYDPGYML
jgi:hypothetical protein